MLSAKSAITGVIREGSRTLSIQTENWAETPLREWVSFLC